MTDGLRLVSAAMCDEARIDLDGERSMTLTGEHTMRELHNGGYRGSLAAVVSGVRGDLSDPDVALAATLTRGGNVVATYTDCAIVAALGGHAWAFVVPVEIASVEPGDYEVTLAVEGYSLGTLPLALR